MMGVLNDLELVLLGQAEDNNVTLSVRSNQHIVSLASDCHREEGFVGFNRVVASLVVLVPYFKRILHSTGDELLLTEVLYARDQVFVDLVISELLLGN